LKGFLLDENLPRHLGISPSLPTQQVGVVGISPSDEQIWEYAQTHDLVIVSKDADFSNRILIASPPPRVVHIRVNNLKLSQFQQLMQQVWPEVERLLAGHKLVNIYPDRLEAVASSLSD
jgi:predicted nuclease of predicted toxin-antitoxin system